MFPVQVADISSRKVNDVDTNQRRFTVARFASSERLQTCKNFQKQKVKKSLEVEAATHIATR